MAGQDTNDDARANSSALAVALEVCILSGMYIVTSCGLISFNKHLMSGPFPHALHLTTMHMASCTLYSLCLYSCAGAKLYPTMNNALANWIQVFKYMLPLGLLFATALYCSNKAYSYSSVAFLQFIKESNVVLMFFLSCLAGLQIFSWKKVGILSIVIGGCYLCITGEMNFLMLGLVLQLAACFSETCKNLIGEIVMTGAGMKLDPLTFVAFQAPSSLVPLLVAMMFHPGHAEAFAALSEHWMTILANTMVAFFLNIAIAITLKRLSALAFTIVGLAKDIVIVVCSAQIFGEVVSQMQWLGFAITILGLGLWSHVKLAERAEAADAARETEKLISKDKKAETYA